MIFTLRRSVIPASHASLPTSPRKKHNHAKPVLSGNFYKLMRADVGIRPYKMSIRYRKTSTLFVGDDAHIVPIDFFVKNDDALAVPGNMAQS